MEQVQMSVTIITPVMAVEMLSNNTRNRPLVSRLVKKYSRIIRRNEWVLNGDAIRISKKGIILDGQHRLGAVVDIGKPIKTVVITGLDDEVFDTIDQGRPRTNGDIFAIKGEINYVELASSLRLLFFYFDSGNPYNNPTERIPTPRQLEALLEHHPGIRNSVALVKSKKWIKDNLTKSIGAFTHYIFSCNDKVVADRFFDALVSGENLTHGSPIKFLRDRLMANRGSKEKLTSTAICALTFKAYKKFRDGETIKSLHLGKTEHTGTDLYELGLSEE